MSYCNSDSCLISRSFFAGAIVFLLKFFFSSAAFSVDEPVANLPKINFALDVQPILKSRCLECHDSAKQRGSLRLDTPMGIKKGGLSGPIINLKTPEESSIILHVKGAKDFERMPPKGDALTAIQIQKLLSWIIQGAVTPS